MLDPVIVSRSVISDRITVNTFIEFILLLFQNSTQELRGLQILKALQKIKTKLSFFTNIFRLEH